jgi:hypothetical protein
LGERVEKVVESHEVGAGEEMLKALSALKQSGEMKQV